MGQNSTNIKKFSNKLLNWNREKNNREMPWKGEKDPYKVWLSEIILQQTRVEQGRDYYKKFIKAYPDINKLAKADDKEVYKLWEGLGYYTRCRNLLATARFISKERKGKFPETYNEILALKGVGSYTAAAIASFAYNLPHAVVDGNVYRVLARFFGYDIPTDTAEGKSFFTKLAYQLLDKKKPGEYNQAIMDFGATVCKPLSPLCSECFLKKDCNAFNTNTVSALPVKIKKLKKKTRWFYYLVLKKGKDLYVNKRKEKDIWQNLYEFVLIEKNAEGSQIEIIQQAEKEKLIKKTGYKVTFVSEIQTQQLTHQTIKGQFFIINISKLPDKKDLEKIPVSKIASLPFPRFITRFLHSNPLNAVK